MVLKESKTLGLREVLILIIMRELQFVQNILNQSLQRVRDGSAKRVRRLHLAMGEIAELEQSSIQNHWAQLSKDTPAEQAELYFRLIPAEVQCMACFAKYHPTNGEIHCPQCGSYGAKILSGEEFYLESIELDYE